MLQVCGHLRANAPLLDVVGQETRLQPSHGSFDPDVERSHAGTV